MQNVLSVLLSIQSLMHDKPYHNEPNFEKDDGSGDVDRYNEKIAHETLRVAVIEVMEDTLRSRAPPNGAVPGFADLRKQLFLVQFGRYHASIDGWIASSDSRVHDGRQFKMMPFESSCNGMRGSFGWKALKERLLVIKAELDAEHASWRQEGAAQAQLLKTTRAIGLAPAVSSLQQQLAELQAEGVDNVSISSCTDNALVWQLSLLGPEGTSWESGCFEVELIFPPTWPDLCAPYSARAARNPVHCSHRQAASRISLRSLFSSSLSLALTAQIAAGPLCDEDVPPQHQHGGLPLSEHTASVARLFCAPANGQNPSGRGARAAHKGAGPRADHACEY